MRVLVIDDDKLIRKTVSRKLKEAGDYIIFEASNFAEAKLVIERQAIDLAFVDMDLGDPNGLSGPIILREFRKSSPSTVVIIQHRYCIDIVTQIKAIKAALSAVETNVIEEHLNHCVYRAINSKSRSETDEMLSEIKNLLKKANK